MRKVNLRMNEDYKYKVIKQLVDHHGNKKRAAIKLGCSIRSINRYIIIYKSIGKAGFVRGNRNRTPAIAFDDSLKKDIISLYLDKYDSSNISHFTELIEEYEDIVVSTRTVNNWLKEIFVLSPKAHRLTRKRMKKSLQDQADTAKSNSERNIAIQNILLIDESNAHPRRPRCSYSGEMIQMDASEYIWFGDTKTQLHVAIDDASGKIVGTYFDTQETLKGYYHTLNMILTNHGIPHMLYTDKRTVFEYTKKKAPSQEEDTFTQFSYACSQLGIEILTTSIPQTKGRVERLNQTLQSRLPIELKLNGISSLEEANAFLDTYIKKFNKRFALQLNSTKSVFEKQPTKRKINTTLARISKRIVDSGHSIKYQNDYYSIRTQMGQALYFPRGTKTLIIEAFDGDKYISVDEKIYTLEIIIDFEEYSRNFDSNIPDIIPKRRYTPPMIHPWRVGYFDAYFTKTKA